ncbi:S1C family serine protease [Burkholderiaceae bacterium UC74_6]
MTQRRLVLQVLAASVVAGFQGSAAAADVIDLIARSKPAVILVGTYAETDNPRFTFKGTGFVVGDGNLAITNAHVLADPGTLEDDASRRMSVMVRRATGEWAPRAVQVVGLDRAHDLALLRFEGAPVTPFKFAQPRLVKEGTEVLILGFPLGGALGFSTVSHRGLVSSVTGIALPPPTAAGLNERSIRQLREGSFDIYQLDATVYPGNSGGPMLDVQTGEVIGIVNATFVKGSKETALTAPSGISYAIPAKYAQDLLQQPR